MRVKNVNKGLLLAAVGLVGALVLATPAIAQQNKLDQATASGTAITSIDLGTLQSMGPGGQFNASTQGMQVSTGSVSETNDLTCEDCIWLDTYSPNNTYNPSVPGSNIINIATTPQVLTTGVPYEITITGTVSYWAASAWLASMIGNPGSAPIFLSPAVATGLQTYTGFDWEYVFAYPNNSHGNFLSGGPLHVVFQGISLDNGATFLDYTPLGGQSYHSAHSYSYLVEGQGQKAAFEVSDNGPHSDNYGRFKICVQKLNPCVNSTCEDNPSGD